MLTAVEGLVMKHVWGRIQDFWLGHVRAVMTSGEAVDKQACMKLGRDQGWRQASEPAAQGWYGIRGDGLDHLRGRQKRGLRNRPQSSPKARCQEAEKV